jgi:hypothetical protein
LRFGTGVGIVAGEQGLDVLVARARPTGPVIAGYLHVETGGKKAAADWGSEVSHFLSGCGVAQRVAAVVVLPRDQIISRIVTLPGVRDADAPQALAFQLDSLHPWGDADVAWAWQRIGQSPSFSVAIAQRELVDHYASLLSEAGIRLAGFTSSGSALFFAARLDDVPPPPGFLAVRGWKAGLDGDEIEIYAESASHPLYNALFSMPSERAVALARSETRLEDEIETVDWVDFLPTWNSAPDSLDLSDAGRSRLSLAWAAALVSACPHLGAPLNLLPPEMRAQSSRIALVPPLVLGVALLCLCGALLGEETWLDNAYLQTLRQQIRRLDPVARRVEVLDRHIADSETRIRTLDGFRRRTRDDLDVLLELTKELPPPADLNSISLTRTEVQIGGESTHAEELLKKLDESPLFVSSEFTTQLTRDGDKEHFRLRTQREREKAAAGGGK